MAHFRGAGNFPADEAAGFYLAFIFEAEFS